MLNKISLSQPKPYLKILMAGRRWLLIGIGFCSCDHSPRRCAQQKAIANKARSLSIRSNPVRWVASKLNPWLFKVPSYERNCEPVPGHSGTERRVYVLHANPEFYFIFNEIANKFRTDEFSIGEVAINFSHPE